MRQVTHVLGMVLLCVAVGCGDKAPSRAESKVIDRLGSVPLKGATYESAIPADSGAHLSGIETFAEFVSAYRKIDVESKVDVVLMPPENILFEAIQSDIGPFESQSKGPVFGGMATNHLEEEELEFFKYGDIQVGVFDGDVVVIRIH